MNRIILSSLLLTVMIATNAFAAEMENIEVSETPKTEKSIKEISKSTLVGTKSAIGFHLGAAMPSVNITNDNYSKEEMEIVNNRVKANKFITTGARLGLALSKNLILQNSLSYIRKGYSFISTSSTVSIDLDYVEFQPSLKLQTPFEQITPYILAGPSIGYLLSANRTYKSATTTTSESQKERFKPIDVTLNAGLGTTLSISDNISFFIEGIYQHGLTNIFDRSAAKGYTRTAQLLSGMMFEI